MHSKLLKTCILIYLLCSTTCFANETPSSNYKKLYSLYRDVQSCDKDKELTSLFKKIKSLQKQIIEEEKVNSKKQLENKSEHFPLENHEDLSLSQFVIQYAPEHLVYLIPPECDNIKIHISSTLTPPEDSWEEILRIVLNAHGVGIKNLNPFIKQLYLMEERKIHVEFLTHEIEELNKLPQHIHVGFLFKEAQDKKQELFSFLQKFSNPNQSSIHLLKEGVFIIGFVSEVKELARIHQFLQSHQKEKTYRLVHLKKLVSSDAKNLLDNLIKEDMKVLVEEADQDAFQTLTISQLPHSILLLGSQEQIQKAESFLEDIETQTILPEEKTTFFYNCRHTDPEELSQTLSQVYSTFLLSHNEGEKAENSSHENAEHQKTPAAHFIIDKKNGAIIVVTKRSSLEKLKELIKKLDIPKKMVSIDILLFEKTIDKDNQFGLRSLGTGSQPFENQHSLSWNNEDKEGILDFILSKSRGAQQVPFNLALRFINSQKNLHINANPSVTTVNQTPAEVSIVDEFSINTGYYETDNQSSKKKSYERAQFGINIKITPTIHTNQNLLNENDEDSITLQTNISFDSVTEQKDLPIVARRTIQNEVRIANGKTIILGGLRRKLSDDSSQKLPFLGDIPGVGKLFSGTQMSSKTTEMFICITPKIIQDPNSELEKIKKLQGQKRPGDSQDFLQALSEAKENERKKTFEKSMRTLFPT